MTSWCRPTYLHVLPRGRNTDGDHPCGFSIYFYSNSCAALTASAVGLRTRVANLVRRWADILDGTSSITLQASGPRETITFDDVVEAIDRGVNVTATNYLNELVASRAGK